VSDQDESTQDDTTDSATNPESIYRAPTSDVSIAPKGDFLAAYVGPKNADYYARRFEQFKAGRSAVSWNWPAFFVTSLWLLYRKMWLYAFGYWIVLPIVLVVFAAVFGALGGESVSGFFFNSTYFFVTLVLAPLFANRLYYRHAQNKVIKVAGVSSSADQQSSELARIGGTSKVVLVVMPFILIAIIGILAAIAIPAYQDYTIRAQVSEGLNLSGAAKAAAAEYFRATGELATDNESAGLPPANTIAGNYVASVAVVSGNVVITYGKQAHAVINGKVLVMTPGTQSERVIVWSCSSQSIAPKHLPVACR